MGGGGWLGEGGRVRRGTVAAACTNVPATRVLKQLTIWMVCIWFRAATFPPFCPPGMFFITWQFGQAPWPLCSWLSSCCGAV